MSGTVPAQLMADIGEKTNVLKAIPKFVERPVGFLAAFAKDSLIGVLVTTPKPLSR